MPKIIEVTQCYHGCPYFSLDGGPGPVMYCNHPSFKEYEGFIITQSNSRGQVPDKCPLRKGESIIHQVVKLKGNQK